MTAPSEETRSMRCSDEEREQTSARLHQAAGEGRLSLTEVEERLAQAYAARYRHELDALTDDLPPVPKPVTGWREGVLRARMYLVAFFAALMGRGDAPMSTRQRLLGLLAVLMVAAIIGAGILSAIHGVFLEGDLEPHGIIEQH
jgi:hypothetical protein